MSDIKSPFPGMDPYLENRAIWPDVHMALIMACKKQITLNLPHNFSVRADSQVTLLTHDDIDYPDIRPDVFVVKNRPVREAQRDSIGIAEPMVLPLSPEIELKERWLEIVDRENRIVVTAIEILSPTNKSGKGHEKFKQKRNDVLTAEVNWLEIDLLRQGKRRHELQRFDYYAMMVRADESRKDRGYVWPMMLREPLVTIGVPLTDGYDDVPLSLQTVIENVYRDNQYWRDLRYEQSPPLPELSNEDGAWAAERLEAWQKAA